MKILVVTPWWPTTSQDPFGSFVRDQTLAIARLGHDVRAVVLRSRRPGRRSADALLVPEESEFPDPTVVGVPWLPYRRTYDTILRLHGRALRCALRRHAGWLRQAVVVVHTQDLAVPAAAALGGTQVPWVLVAHGSEPESPRYERRSRQDRWRRALERSARVIAVGPSLAVELRAEAPRADVRCVPNGFDPGAVHDLAPVGPVQPVPRFVSLGNLVPGKGIHLVLDALARLGEAAAWTYDVVGDGPERRRLEAQVVARGWSGRVRFHGRLPRAAALRVVAGARAFLLPSAPEAFGIAYLEAMALGVPVVGVRGQGPSAFVRDRVDGFLVERDVEPLARAIDTLLRDPAGAAAMGDAARAQAASRTWLDAARDLVANLPVAPPPPVVPRTWISLYEEPTPYVTAKLDRVEADGRVRWWRMWVSRDRSQVWAEDVAPDAGCCLDTRARIRQALGVVLRRRVAGLHAGGWGGSRVLPVLLAAAVAVRLPLSIEFDTHVRSSRGFRAWARGAWLRFLDRRVLAWWPGGTPQAEHLRSVGCRRGRVVVERMTTDTATLARLAAEAGPEAGGRWRREHGVPEGASLVLFVGRLVEEKGVGDLLAAVARLRAGGSDVRVALLGPGDLAPFRVPGLPPEAVVAPGRTSWRDLVPAYLAADVFALPSRAEPWGLVVNEALLLGCPVVTTSAVGAARDLVLGPGAGCVVPPRDVAALADALRSVLAEGGRTSTRAARGRAVMAGWTTEGAAGRILEVLARSGHGPVVRPC